MIKGLRKKFILINMTLVTLVLLIVFSVLYVSNQRKYDEDSKRVLESTLQNDRQDIGRKTDIKNDDGGPPEEMAMNLVFIVYLNADNSIAQIDDSGVSITDSFAETAVQAVLEKGNTSGTIRDLRLKYMSAETQSGTKIAFKDYSFEISGMQNLLLNSVLMFAAGVLAFFVISVFLARWALAPVEKAWRQQRQFVADASHELKTPLTVIMANLGILAAHKSDTIQEQYQWLENTRMEAGRMKELLNNLLFLARSDSSQMPVEFSEVDLSSAVLSCILPFESLAYENDIALKDEVDQGIRIIGDEKQLKQLTVILLDNACKYAGKKGKVTVRLSRKTDRPERIILKVTNTGEVIPEEDLEHIFERFYRSDKSRVRTKGGYGLGLAIAQTIVEQHHGKIKVASSEEEGTVFTAEFHGETIL